jgi:hypothetical protein
LVGTDHPAEVRDRLTATGLAVLDRDQLKAADLAVMTRAFAVPVKVMVAVGFAVGSLMIALTAYSTAGERRREFGIVRALGATRVHLYHLAVAQTSMLAVAGLVVGVVLFLIGRELIGRVRPQFTIVVAPTVVVRWWGRRQSWAWWPRSCRRGGSPASIRPRRTGEVERCRRVCRWRAATCSRTAAVPAWRSPAWPLPWCWCSC